MFMQLINQMYVAANNVKRRNNYKIKIKIYIDLLICMLKYGASPNNYDKFEFDKLNKNQRKTYVTHRLSNQMINQLNESGYRDIFENKLEFAKRFENYFNREYISSKCTEEEFIRFAKKHPKAIYKPICMAQAEGIQVLNFSEDIDELKGVYFEINKLTEGIIEEWIEQDSTISEIYPDAVNCLRIITVYDNNKANLLTGGMTFALDGEIANGSKKSLIAPVNMETGIIDKPAATFGSDIYINHPATNKKILGFQVPYWNEVVKLLNNAVKVVPEVRYVGWDIAITKNGPCLIEGNTSPGYRYYQIPKHLDNGIGNRDKYEKFLRK